MLGRILERGLAVPIKVFGGAAAVLIGVMAVYGGADVVGRFAFNCPLPGGVELIELLMVLVVFLCLAWVAAQDGHVRIDVVFRFLPRRAQAIIDSVTSLLGVALWLIVAWQGWVRGWENTVGQYPASTVILSIPVAPFLFVMAVGCTMLSLQLLADFCHSVAQVSRRGWE